MSPALLQQLKRSLCSWIDERALELRMLSEDIWSRPELAYEEHRAHDRLVDFFRGQDTDWQVDPHFRLQTAFRATWTPADRQPQGHVVNVGYLCEYDALPGIGHACGHNLIAEVGAAAAVGLQHVLEVDRQKIPVDVQITVLGTPAEEDGGGKIDLIREGAFEGLDVVFMAHPAKEDAVYLPCVAAHEYVSPCGSPDQAFCGRPTITVTVTYRGKASHASAYPWEGVNALDAAVLCYNNLSVLRQQMKPDWRVHGIIKHGGEKPNIIPAFTQLEYCLRTPSRAELPVLEERAERCFRSAADATGCQVETVFAKNQFDNMLRFPVLEELYEKNGRDLGMDFTTDEAVLKESGSTDFGNVTFVAPGIHPYFYIGSDALNHTEEYTVAAGDPKAQFFTLRTAKALSMTALDLLLRPELLQRVKEEFTEAKLKEERTGAGGTTQRA